jgi:outer membrane lipoprotein SlyB
MRRPSSSIATVMIVASLALAAGGCARQISPSTVDGARVGAVQQSFRGTVENIRVVTVEEGDQLQNNTLGIIVGGLAGAALGSTVGGGTGRIIASGAGAVAGAAAGSVAQREVSRQEAVEYTVQLDDGRLLTIVQGPGEPIIVGDRVIVQTGGGARARVIRG